MSFGVFVDVKNFFIGSLVILSAEINVGCASVIVDEWVGAFIMFGGASILLVCCMTSELVCTASESDNWCRDSTFLRVSGKCLKSFNFGIFELLYGYLKFHAEENGSWEEILCKFRMISKLFCR